MTMELFISAAVAGYLTPPLVSLAKRNSWGRTAKFLLASALAFGAAALGLVVQGIDLGMETLWEAFTTAFLVQQAAWRLDPIGTGSSAINGALGDLDLYAKLGLKAEASADVGGDE